MWISEYAVDNSVSSRQSLVNLGLVENKKVKRGLRKNTYPLIPNP